MQSIGLETTTRTRYERQGSVLTLVSRSCFPGLLAATTTLLLSLSFAFAQERFPRLIRNHVPAQWQAVDVRWRGDLQPRNKLDDFIDRSREDIFNVIINYKRCPEDADMERLRRLAPNAKLEFRSRYLASLLVANVSRAELLALAELPEVAFIEHQFEYELHLNTSLPSICVTPGPCSPNTVQEAFPGINGAGVNIAIIDSGVDDGVHDTLPGGRFIAGYNAVTHVFENPNDVLFHGTHVASIALGQAGATVARGVAPGAGLIDVKLTDTATFPPGRIFEALETVYDNRTTWNVGVINMSLGSSVPSDGTDATCQLIDLAESMGIVVVISAGNSGPATVIGSPGAATRAITVAAVETMNTSARGDDGIACFSSRGPRITDGDADNRDELKPELAAPGTHLDVAVPTCVPGSGTGINAARWNTASTAIRLEGTSMAAPHVAGLAALVRQARPDINAASVKALLIATATPIGPPSNPAVDPIWNNASGWGEVNGFAALGTAAQTDLTYPSHPPSPGWLSPDITTSPFPPKVGVPTTVTVIVTNRGPVAATAANIHLGVHVFSAATPTFDDIGTIIVDIPPFTAVPVSISWTPQNASHQCLKAEIGYGPDSDYSNNHAQRNITVQSSPATFTVANTLTEEPSLIQLLTFFADPDQKNWPFEISQRQLVLGAMDCPQQIQVELFPPDDAPYGAAQTVHVAAVMDTPFGPVELGGVSVTAIKRPPGLTIQRVPGTKQIRICWPGPATGFVLQAAPSLRPVIAWADLNLPVDASNDVKCVTLEPTEDKNFFRLRSDCFEFSGQTPGPVPNPWSVPGVRFTVQDARGQNLPSGRLDTVGGLIGLDSGFRLIADLSNPCRRLRVTLLRLNSAPTVIRAYDATNGLVDSATLLDPPAGPEDVILDGGAQAIVRVVIEPSQDETLLLKLCCAADDPPTGDFFNPYEVPVDDLNNVNEVEIDKEGRPSAFKRDVLTREHFTFEPFPHERKPDEVQVMQPSKISPILTEWLQFSNVNNEVEILINLADSLRVPLLPDLLPNEDREKGQTRREAAIATLADRRAVEQRVTLEKLQRYAGNDRLEAVEHFWIVNAMRVKTALRAVVPLQEAAEVLYLQPVAGNEPPPADGNPNNDTADGRAWIVSDPYFNLGLTQPWIGLLDTGVRDSHVMFNAPDHLAFLRDCVNGGVNCNNTAAPGYNTTDFAWNHGTCSASILTGNAALGAAFRGVTAIQLDSWQIYTAAGLNTVAAVRGIQRGVAVSDKVLVGEIQAEETETGTIATAADNAYDAGVIFVAANGNYGPAASTVRSPGIAHKVIGVGAFLTDGGTQYGNQGRGPATDGRYKPDIQAPSYSETASASGDSALKVFGGTSGATPYAAASAMLARNWLRNFGTYDNGQTYALMILYGQRAYPYDNTEGAGKLSMAVNGHAWWGKIVVPNGGTINIPIGLSGKRDFDGALWWPEQASQSHNDIDLHLIDPSGTQRAIGYSGPSVFERARVSGVVANGTWTLRIRGYSVPTGSQVVYWAAHAVNN